MGVTNLDALAIGGALVGMGLAGLMQPRTPIPGSKVIYVVPSGYVMPDGLVTATSIFGTGGAVAQLNGRANKGDIIYVMPGYTESIAASTDINTIGNGATGFSIIGLGVRTQRPTLTWTAAGSALLMDVAGVEIANMRLHLAGASTTGTLTVTTPITVSAASCRIVGCAINWGQDTDSGCGGTLGAIAVTSTDFEFIGNRCVNLDTAGTLAVSLLSINGGDNLIVMANEIYGGTTATTVGAIHFVTTASLNVKILWNYVENLHSSSTKAISSAISGVTGTIAYNQLRVNSGILGFTVSANLSVSLFQNFTNNTVNKNGALDVGAGTSA